PELAGLDELGDVAGHVLADVGETGEVGVLADEAGEGLRVALDELRGAAVGAHAEGVRALDVEQVGDLVQRACDVDVLHAPSRLQRPVAVTGSSRARPPSPSSPPSRGGRPSTRRWRGGVA